MMPPLIAWRRKSRQPSRTILSRSDHSTRQQRRKAIRSMVLKNQYRNAVFRGQDEQAEEFGKKLLEADPQVDLKALRVEALVRKDVMAYFGAVTGQTTSAPTQRNWAPISPKKSKGRPNSATTLPGPF
jgi:hypothetical protein